MVQRDPWSGQRFVYLGDHAWLIAGMDVNRSACEIDRLNRFITADGHVYSHRWQAGDLLILKNRLLPHRWEPGGNPSAPRVLRRTTVWLR